MTLSASMSWRVEVGSDYNGYLGITQLVSGNTSPYVTDGYVLDGDYAIYGDKKNGQANQYITNDPTTHTIELLDTPTGYAYPNCVEMNASFDDYLRFCPEGDSRNIFVTLATISWSMDGEACFTSGMTSSNLPPASKPADSDEFPKYSANYSE